MSKKRKGSTGRTFIGFILISIGVVFCSTTSIIGIDAYCRADIDKWLPIYPDAELIEADSEGFFRSRAMGITEQLYYTEVETVDVRRWYTDYRRELTQGSYNAGNSESAVSGLATTNYSIFEDRDNGGTFIRAYSECAYG